MTDNNPFEKLMFELANDISKPYFKNLNSTFRHGLYKDRKYIDIWINFPDHIEWLILNQDLLIDIEEFNKIRNTKNYTLSQKAIDRLSQHHHRLDFERNKNIIRKEWRETQEQNLRRITGKNHFTEELKETLLSLLTKRNQLSKLEDTWHALNLLGIKLTNFSLVFNDFKDNLFNKYHHRSFVDFLYSCIYYGCGTYYKETKLKIEKETLLKIKRKELTEVVIPYKTLNSIKAYDKEILRIEDQLFFIKNTDYNAKLNGVKIGKIYSVSKFVQSDIAYNWFDYSSSIETRVDILLSIEQVQRHIRNQFILDSTI